MRDSKIGQQRWNELSPLRRLMKIFEPKSFYDDTQFSAESGAADAWRFLWVLEKVLIVLGSILWYLDLFKPLPLVLFVFWCCWSVRFVIRRKSKMGYPYPEPRDLFPVIFVNFFIGLVCLGTFLVS
jgi:hypothetical protein